MKSVPALIRFTHRTALGAIVVIFILSAVLYALSTPLLEVSDELRHYAMIEHLAQGNGLPRQDPAQHGFYEQEGSQPPLYYALMALVVLPFDRSDFMALAQPNPHAQSGRADATNNWNLLIHTAAWQFPWQKTVLVTQFIRLISLLMGAASVLCVYAFARELTATRDALTHDWVPVLAAALTAFNPMFVFISASVNNDNLIILLNSVGLLLGARAIRRGLTRWRAVLLGVVLGCATLSKVSALALAVVVPMTILLAEYLRARPVNLRAALQTLRPQLGHLALMVGIAVAIGGWWYVRNAILYDGDFTGTTMMAIIAGARDALPSMSELLGEWNGFRKAYWGLFGGVNIPMHEPIYVFFDVLLILSGVGLLRVGRDFARSLKTADASSRIALWTDQALPVLLGVSTFAVAFVALIRWTSMTFASQGRLLFPVIAVISTLMSMGLFRLLQVVLRATQQRGLLRHTAPVIMTALVVGLAALTMLAPLVYIRPAYATPALMDESSLPADIVPTELYFGDGIRWIGYRTHSERVQPGEEFIITLYWQGLKPISDNYSAFIRLFGRDERELLLLDTYPGGGMWQTTRWLPGQVIADRYRLRIPQTVTVTQAMPTVLRLDVGYWDMQTQQFLQTYDAAGNPTGRQRYEAGALALSASPQPGSGARLEQARIASNDTAHVDGRLYFTVTWAVTNDFTDDYTVFAHLFNAAGEKVAQADGRAANGDFSARWWRAGDIIVDPHVFQLPPELEAGSYEIRYGLYRPSNGARMPASDENRNLLPDMALTLPVTIK